MAPLPGTVRPHWDHRLCAALGPGGVVLRADDPLAGRDILHVRDLGDRRWFRLPDGTGPVWRTYWNGATLGPGPCCPPGLSI